MTIFETITGANVKDCVQIDDAIGFLVEQGYMGLAIGKSGKSIEKVRKSIGKKVMVVEYAEDTVKFVKNLFQPVMIRQARITETGTGKIAVIEVSKKDRAKAFGYNGERIKIAKEMLDRHCSLSDVIIKTI